MSGEDLPWAPWWVGFWPPGQCAAVREARFAGDYYGRCDLRRRHEGDHALERGMDTPRWSTDWTCSNQRSPS